MRPPLLAEGLLLLLAEVVLPPELVVAVRVDAVEPLGVAVLLARGPMIRPVEQLGLVPPADPPELALVAPVAQPDPELHLLLCIKFKRK